MNEFCCFCRYRRLLLSSSSRKNRKSKIASRFAHGRIVLIGDAAAAFPPFGQGVNAAMEAATLLDGCIGAELRRSTNNDNATAVRSSSSSSSSGSGSSGRGGALTTADLRTLCAIAAARYSAVWRPEVVAVRDIALSVDMAHRSMIPKVLLLNLVMRFALFFFFVELLFIMQKNKNNKNKKL